MSSRRLACVYVIASAVAGLAVFAAFSAAHAGRGTRARQAPSGIQYALGANGCARAEIQTPATNQQTPAGGTDWWGILVGSVVVLQGVVMGFLIDFWGGYRKFLREELDWAGCADQKDW